MGELLFNEGLAMENLRDIDSQSIAGAISNSTQLIKCSRIKNELLFKVANLSFCSLEVIIEITKQCVPANKLSLQNGKENVNDVLATLDKRNK